MAVVGVVFGAIASAITSAATAVAAVVTTISTAVASAVVAAATAVASVVSSIVSAIGVAISDFYIGLTTYLEGIFVLADYAGTSFMTQLGAYVGAIYSTFTGFLAAIHFKTILAIHEIVYLVSEDYREMWQGVYREIANVSNALGFTSEFLYLTLRDARTLVLDVSSTMGRKYDLAEITWLQEMNKFFKDFSTVAKTYQNNPSQLFWDIDQKIIRPSIDTKGDVSQMVLSTVDSAIRVAKEAVDDISRIRYDIGSLISHLPSQIRDEIKPAIDKVLKQWDDWIKEDYKPIMTGLTKVTDHLQYNQRAITVTLSDVVSRLLRPGDFLREIYRGTPDEARDQQKKIADISKSEFIEESQDWYARHRTERKEYEEEVRIREIELPSPPIVKGERVEIEGETIPPMIPRKGWFVGDY